MRAGNTGAESPDSGVRAGFEAVATERRIPARRVLFGLIAGGILGWAVTIGVACTAISLSNDQPCAIRSALRL